MVLQTDAKRFLVSKHNADGVGFLLIHFFQIPLVRYHVDRTERRVHRLTIRHDEANKNNSIQCWIRKLRIMMRTIERSTCKLQLTDDSSERRLATASSQVLKEQEFKNQDFVVNTICTSRRDKFNSLSWLTVSWFYEPVFFAEFIKCRQIILLI